MKNPDEAEIDDVIGDLRKLGAKSVIITSDSLEGKHLVIGYDHREDRIFRVPFEYLPVRFPGTGDIFSSVLLGGIMKQESLEQSVSRAVRTVHAMIAASMENKDRFRGIDIEDCLGEIRQ